MFILLPQAQTLTRAGAEKGAGPPRTGDATQTFSVSGVQIGAKSASGFCCCAFNSPGPFLDLYLFKNINSVDYFANSLHTALPSLPQRDPLLFYFFFLSEAWREAPGKACRDFELTVPSSAGRDT